MGTTDDSILPLIERNTPILDKIRGADEDTVASSIGKLTGELVLEDDNAFAEEQKTLFEEGFVDALSDELDVPVESIDGEFVEGVSEFMSEASLETVLTEEAYDHIMGEVKPSVDEEPDTSESDTEEEEEDEFL